MSGLPKHDALSEVVAGQHFLSALNSGGSFEKIIIFEPL